MARLGEEPEDGFPVVFKSPYIEERRLFRFSAPQEVKLSNI